jgi:hypothetical protein
MPRHDAAQEKPGLRFLELPDDCLALVLDRLTMTDTMTVMVSWVYMDKLLKSVRSIEIREKVRWQPLRNLYQSSQRGFLVFPNVRYVECSVLCALPDDPGPLLFPKASVFKARDCARAGDYISEFARRLATRTIYPAHLEHLRGDATILSAVMTHLETNAKLHSITWDWDCGSSPRHRLFAAGIYEIASQATIQEYLNANSRIITRLRGTGPQRRTRMFGLKWDKLEYVDVHWAGPEPILQLPSLRQVDWWGDMADTFEPWVKAVSSFSPSRATGIGINIRESWMQSPAGMRHLLLQYVPVSALLDAVKSMKESRVARWETELLAVPGRLNPYMIYHIQLRATNPARARESTRACLVSMTDSTPWVVQMRGRRGWRNPLMWANLFTWNADPEYAERRDVLEAISRALVYAGVCLLPTEAQANKYAVSRWHSVEALLGAPYRELPRRNCAEAELDAFFHMLDGYMTKPLAWQVAETFRIVARGPTRLWERRHPLLDRIVGDITPGRFEGSIKRLFIAMVLVVPPHDTHYEAVPGLVYDMRLVMFGHILLHIYPDVYVECFRAVSGGLYDGGGVNRIDILDRRDCDPRMRSWIMKLGGDDVILPRRVHGN